LAEWVYCSKASGSEARLRSLLEAHRLSFDVEATGTDVGSDVPIGFSLACSGDDGYYTQMENHFFKSLLAMDKLYIAHNASYDRSMMKKGGVIVDNLACTQIAAHLLEEPQLSLKELTGHKVRSFNELKHGFAGMSTKDIGDYSCPHAMETYLLWEQQEQQLKELALLKLFWSIEMPLVPVISDMEFNGVMVDKQVLSGLGELFDEKIEMLKEALDYWSGTSNVNFNSPDQLADVLFSKLGLPPHPWRRTASGRSTVLAKYLEQIKSQHPFLPVYLAYKQLMTLKNNYVNSLGASIHSDGRVYGKFNQTNTRTGRLSSSGPNLQKIPERTELGRRIRTAFIAPEGKKLLKADYDILELKMLAIASKNRALLDAFKQGKDIHNETAMRAYRTLSMRPRAKTLNYQIVYGGGGIADRGMFFRAYPGVQEWIQSIHKQAREAHYITTLNGRIRTIPEYMQDDLFTLDDRRTAHGDREALSTLIQGTSAEEVKVGMRQVWEKLRDSAVKMLLQVHDEILFEVPADIIMDVAKVIKEQMTIRRYEIPLTVSISVGDNWGEMTKLEV